MALVRKVRGHVPEIGENTFLAETATIIGDVTIGKDCSIWYGAVLRGDVNKITIGDRTNIQDGAVIHTLYDKSPKPSQTHIGNDVSVGHNATIHGEWGLQSYNHRNGVLPVTGKSSEENPQLQTRAQLANTLTST